MSLLFIIPSKQMMKNVIKTGSMRHGIQQTWDQLDSGIDISIYVSTNVLLK